MYGILFTSALTHNCLVTSLKLILQVNTGVSTSLPWLMVGPPCWVELLPLASLIQVCNSNEKSYVAWHWHIIGSSLILLSPKAFKTYQDLTGAVLDHTTGLYTFTSDQFQKLKNLTVTIANVCI